MLREIDKREFARWEQIRGRGRGRYMLRWTGAVAAFMLVVHGGVALVTGRAPHLSDAAAWLMATAVTGLAVAIVRWSAFERRFAASAERER